jgi:hypothetical protein
MKKKKAPLLPLLAIVCFPLILMTAGLLSCYHANGFSLSKIRSNLPFNSNWETDPLNENQKTHLTKDVFHQTFYYLSSGTHCYTFISEDKNYILKFFKSKSLSPKGWLNFYPISLLRHLGWSDRLDNQFLSEHVFANYKNAYESLRAESGLIYIHLNRNREFKTHACLIDAKGKKHLIDLDTVEFILQKRGVPIFEHLESLIQSNDLETFKASIRSFFQMIAIRCEKGFASQNVSLHNHFGFIREQPIQFDCGLLTKDLSMKYPMNIQREILQATERLNLWASEHHPEVTFIIQEEAQRTINQIF